MKRLFKSVAALMIVMVALVSMSTVVMAASHPDRVVDEPGILSSSERSSLESELDKLSDEYEIDFAVVIVDSFTESSVVRAADNYYDRNGYGLGDKASGVMFYIAMESRDWCISTSGTAAKMITSSEAEEIGSAVVSYLSSGDYYKAFTKFANLCAGEVEDATTFHVFRYLLISIVVGVIAAFIRIMVLKSNLKSVAPVDDATDYVVRGSLNMRRQRELLLYKKVTAREKNTNETHRSEAGVQHGGASGKF